MTNFKEREAFEANMLKLVKAALELRYSEQEISASALLTGFIVQAATAHFLPLLEAKDAEIAELRGLLGEASETTHNCCNCIEKAQDKTLHRRIAAALAKKGE